MRIHLLMLLLTLSLTVIAAEEDNQPKSMEAWADRVMDRTREWVSERLEAVEHREAEPLDKTLRLTFVISSDDNQRHVFVITTATNRFFLELDHGNDEESGHVRIAGLLVPQDGRYLLQHETELNHQADDSHTQIAVAGSTHVFVGKTVQLSMAGTQQLSVTVDEIK